MQISADYEELHMNQRTLKIYITYFSPRASALLHAKNGTLDMRGGSQCWISRRQSAG